MGRMCMAARGPVRLFCLLKHFLVDLGRVFACKLFLPLLFEEVLVVGGHHAALVGGLFGGCNHAVEVREVESRSEEHTSELQSQR